MSTVRGREESWPRRSKSVHETEIPWLATIPSTLTVEVRSGRDAGFMAGRGSVTRFSFFDLIHAGSGLKLSGGWRKHFHPTAREVDSWSTRDNSERPSSKIDRAFTQQHLQHLEYIRRAGGELDGIVESSKIVGRKLCLELRGDF